MIHGGGHIMLSRKDVRPKQTRLLLDKGLLPISIDYRLCPEVPIDQGPMRDVCTALKWIRTTLPELQLLRSDILPDTTRVAVIGWSTGGTLAMTLAWTSVASGIKPPDAILSFYCPTDYESEFWRSPNFPENTQKKAQDAGKSYNLLEGVQDRAILAYNVPPQERAVGGWMSLSDPRSRIALHMNWRGQALPTLLDGLPSLRSIPPNDDTDWHDRPQPDPRRVADISPYARIVRGDYRTPTYLIHGTQDDLVPWQQTQKTVDALNAQGVANGVSMVDGAVHLFDLYRDTQGKHWAAVLQGYEFLFRQLGLH